MKYRYFKQSISLNECGQGLALGFNVTTKDGLKSLSDRAGLDRIGSETTATLKLMFNSQFYGGTVRKLTELSLVLRRK